MDCECTASGPCSEGAHPGPEGMIENRHLVETHPLATALRSDSLVYGAYFNAGVRACARRVEPMGASRGGLLHPGGAGELAVRRGPDERRVRGREWPDLGHRANQGRVVGCTCWRGRGEPRGVACGQTRGLSCGSCSKFSSRRIDPSDNSVLCRDDGPLDGGLLL